MSQKSTGYVPKCFIPGRCEHSEYLHSSFVETPNDCLYRCKGNDKCSWFTIDSSNGFCIEYSDCIDLAADHCPNCISGESTCQKQLQCSVTGECQGTVIAAFENVTLESDCQNICWKNEKCQWYTFLSDTGFCLTYEDCTFLDDSITIALSGERNCSILSGK